MTHLDPKALEAIADAIDAVPEWPARTYRLRVAEAAYHAALPQAEPVDQRLPLANAILDLAFTDAPTEQQMVLNGGFIKAANVARDWPTPLFASPTPAVSREDVIEECARLVDDVMKAEKPGRSKMMLAIAAKTVRRGRHLTDSEKHANLMRAMREAEDAALSQPHSEK